MASKCNDSRRSTRYMLINFMLNPFGYLENAEHAETY
jgi:hypothetical protein